MIAVDSSVWIDFFRGTPSLAVDKLAQLMARGDTRLVVPDVVLYEVLRGFRHEREYRQAEQLMAAFDVEPTVSPRMVVSAAQHYRAMLAVGRSIRSAIDVLIATFCIERGYTLLHNDRDFDALAEFRGLSCLNTAQQPLAPITH